MFQNIFYTIRAVKIDTFSNSKGYYKLRDEKDWKITIFSTREVMLVRKYYF